MGDRIDVYQKRYVNHKKIEHRCAIWNRKHLWIAEIKSLSKMQAFIKTKITVFRASLTRLFFSA